MNPDALLKVAQAAGPHVLESNRWDALNRLIGNTNAYGDITTYKYDGDGNRVSMRTTIGDGAIQDAYLSSNPAWNRDGWEPQYKKRQIDIYFTNDITMSIPQPLMATGADGQNWKQSYVYGAGEERISMSYLVSGDESNDWEPADGASGAGAAAAAPKTLYYLSDAQGSVIGLEGQDGSMSARYRYDEFGVAENPEKFDLNWSGPDNLFGYTSLGYDYYSGYSHAQARDFDSSIGRFMSEDTYEGDINDPQTLNLYTYVKNNPLKFIDPTGHMEEIGGSAFETRMIGSNGVLYYTNGSVAWDYYLAWRNSDRLAFDKLANSGKGISRDQMMVMRFTLSFITYVDDGTLVLMMEGNGQHGLAKEIMEKYGVKEGTKIIVKGANSAAKEIADSGKIPRSGAEWNEYYKSKYGNKNVVWVSELKSYNDILNNPKALWGKSADEVGKALGNGWTRGTYGSAGTGWKFTSGDKSVFYHPGGGIHGGSYVGFSSGQTGKVKVVGSDYKPLPGDKAIIIQK
ncbi:RHS repeat domain-containing protein [Paenibacillus sp. sgz500992]|uniref:RHS repeat domain-containing protein n=1 Tax=Paenibacillus sp. sgz500992 TaxID=3242476 RepID=UPI0036D3A27D